LDTPIKSVILQSNLQSLINHKFNTVTLKRKQFANLATLNSLLNSKIKHSNKWTHFSQRSSLNSCYPASFSKM